MQYIPVFSPKYLSRQNIGTRAYWHPWVGCTKISEACRHCWVSAEPNFNFRGFEVEQLKKLADGTVVSVTLKSDFFYPPADIYRPEAWKIIKEFSNLIFLIITKYSDRIAECLPDDWEQGYDNVILSVTVENNKRAYERIPKFKEIPAKHKWLSLAPLLEEINLDSFLEGNWIECIEVLGERKFNRDTEIEQLRECRYEWVEHISKQCSAHNIRFSFLGAGHRFIYNSEIYIDYSSCYHSKFADDLNLDVFSPIIFNLKNGVKII